MSLPSKSVLLETPLIIFKVFTLICPVIHHKVSPSFLWQLNRAVIFKWLFLNCCCHQLLICHFRRSYANFPANLSSLWMSHSGLLSSLVCSFARCYCILFYHIKFRITLDRQKCQNDADECCFYYGYRWIRRMQLWWVLIMGFLLMRQSKSFNRETEIWTRTLKKKKNTKKQPTKLYEQMSILFRKN